MIGLALVAATFLTTLPVLVALLWRWRRETTLGELALSIPLAVAVDLLAVLTLSRFVRLELAVLVARGLWAGGAGVTLAMQPVRARCSWPLALTPRRVVAVVAAAALAALASAHLSRPYAIFDRGWHIPLVASLRAQRVPFVNVFDPRVGLHYHFAGDVLAALVQTLSGDVLHSSLALSLTHDILFAEAAAALALLLLHLGVRGAASVAVSLAVLLFGPASVFLGREKRLWSGYSLVSLYQLSFRPHVALALLLFVGVLGPILLRLHAGARGRQALPAASTAPALLASTAALSLTDETSIGLLGLAIGTAWLFEADVLHPRRRVGLAMLAGLLAAIAAPQLLFGGSLAPGAQHHAMKLVSWRAPGFYNPPLALSTSEGRWALAADFLPALGLWVAGLVVAIRTTCREVRVAFAALTALAAVTVLCVTRLDVDASPTECHRFAVALEFAAPLLGAVFVLSPWSRVPAMSRAIVFASLGLAAVSTLEWTATLAPVIAKKPADFYPGDSLHDISCREVGSSLADSAKLTYLDQSLWYLYAGCRPIFAPASRGQNWDLQTKDPLQGQAAFDELQRMLGDHQDQKDLVIVCAPGTGDPVCRGSAQRYRCDPAGTRAIRCTMPSGGAPGR
jgi:hypothetical protein